MGANRKLRRKAIKKAYNLEEKKEVPFKNVWKQVNKLVRGLQRKK